MKYSGKPKITITCPPAPDNGPTYYASELAKHLDARILVFSSRLPTGLRHIWFFVRIIFARADAIIALDNYSVAWSSVWAGIVTRRKVIVRIGGDFLWESYVNRTGNAISLSRFYQDAKDLSAKERVIKLLTQFIYNRAGGIVFSTEWQREITERAYKIDDNKISVIDNFIGPKQESTSPSSKNFVWIGRDIPLKNLDRLERAFEEAKRQVPDINLEIYKNLPQDLVWQKLASCYAFILPSVSEVSPNLVLQALQYNKPVIMTQESGFADMLSNTVVLVDPLSETDMSEKIVHLANPKTYKIYQEKARSFTQVNTYQDIAQEFISVLNKS